jgi:hypothetical protein
MVRKKNAIVLDKLARESAIELDSMLDELMAHGQQHANDRATPSQWSRRFAASGKHTLIRPFEKS